MASCPKTISVIIPALNEEAYLPALLGLLVKRAPHEIIVTDGGSTDATADICREFGVTFLHGTAGRGLQMNRGAEISTGDILFFVHADSILPENWESEIRSLLHKPDVLAGSFCLEFDKNSFFLNFYARCSRRAHWLFTYGDQGLFLHREVFHQIGGFLQPRLMEDVDILRRLHRKGRVVKSALAITTSSRRYEQNGIILQQARNTMLLMAYLAGISPELLARYYH
ncbi:MAG: TIGR04283 family arsenosugar biosynthesis glycosyltransferase [Cyclobacteriaceae bacterium]